LLGKYGKLLLSVYLLEKLRKGERFGTREAEESTGGLLKKYGKLMLTTFAVKKLRSKEVSYETKKSQQGVEESAMKCCLLLHNTMKKCGIVLIGAYLLKKIYHREIETKVTKELENKEYKKSEGPRMVKLSTIVMVAAAGATAVYAVKKHRSKRKWYQIKMR
jgi:hypothetical protein